MKRQRGVILITTILMAIIVAMVVTATISRAPTALTSAAGYTDHQRALLAVDAGIAYARARFQEDLNWLGSHDSGPNVIVRAPDESLVVVEDHGNVVGTIRFDGGQYGQFRIRFNHQDGSSFGNNLDGFADPTPDFELDMPEISANNLMNGSSEALFESADEKPPEATDQVVQPFQAHIAVEGLAGPALRDVNPMRPNSVNQSLRLVKRTGEARIQANYSDSLDAAAMAAGDLTGHLSLGSLDEAVKNGNPVPRRLMVDAVQKKSDPKPPRLRTKGVLDVTNDQAASSVVTANGFLNTASGDVSSGTSVSTNTSLEYEDASSGFYNMSWDDVSRADPSDPDTIKLRAGTYVVWEKTTASGDAVPELHYYDKTLEDYKADMKALPPNTPPDPGLVLTSNLQEVRSNFASSKTDGIFLHVTESTERSYTNGLRAQLVMRDDVLVEPTANTSDFNFLSSKGFIRDELESDPVTGQQRFEGQVSDDGYSPQQIMFQFHPRAEEEVCLTVPGETNVNARIHGEGASMVSEGDITIVGAGSLESNEADGEDDGLSLYSREDVEVTTFYPPNNGGTGGRYTNLKINGVVYAWGDVTFALAPEVGLQSNHHGNLRVSGAVVAYGGDPGDAVDNTPGSGFDGNRGHIQIRALSAHLRYNPNYLLALDKLVSASNMEVLSFTLK